MRLLLALMFLVLSPALAFAHTGAEHGSGFVHGFEHPIGGLDHVLAMVAVGVFAFVLGGRALVLVPLAFLLMMVVGFVVGAGGIALPHVELAIALSSLVIGAVAASGKPVPAGAAMALVGAFALFHGHAHGAEMPADATGFGYAAGFVQATAFLHAAGIGVSLFGARLAGRHGKLAAQLAAGIFALGGAGVLAGWL
mgnify:CR=1 FL=1